jgi:hypothetical protein
MLLIDDNVILRKILRRPGANAHFDTALLHSGWQTYEVLDVLGFVGAALRQNETAETDK